MFPALTTGNPGIEKTGKPDAPSWVEARPTLCGHGQSEYQEEGISVNPKCFL